MFLRYACCRGLHTFFPISSFFTSRTYQSPCILQLIETRSSAVELSHQEAFLWITEDLETRWSFALIRMKKSSKICVQLQKRSRSSSPASKRWVQSTISQDGAFYQHLHMSAGESSGAVFGGHLSRAVVSATCEMIVRVIDGRVERVLDPDIGLNLFRFF